MGLVSYEVAQSSLPNGKEAPRAWPRGAERRAGGGVHTWEADKRYKLFIRPFRGLSVPRIRRCGLAVLPHLDSCTLWSS